MSRLEAFKDNTDLIKVLTGVRRCGKSTLLNQYCEKLMQSGVKSCEILQINFESSKYNWIKDYTTLSEYLMKSIPNKGRFYVVLDEIQRVDEWERSVNALMVDTEADIYITGSNAHILSSDLSTYLTGRYVEIRMLPLSFSEYCDYRGNGRSKETVFREYFEYGGFPTVDAEQGEISATSTLKDLYDSILNNDIVRRSDIRNHTELDNLVRHLFLNIGNPVSVNSIARELGINVRTAEKYASLVQDACLFYRVDRYDLRSTALNPTPKYYAVDQGLRNNEVGMASKDRGRVLENMVYLELSRRGYKVMVGKWNSKEIDFVTSKHGRQEYWQVCLGYYDDETEQRELAPLRAIDDNNRKTVILLDSAMSRFTKDGIRELSAIDFFLGEDEGIE